MSTCELLFVIKAWHAFLLLLVLPVNVCTKDLVVQAHSIGSCSVLAELHRLCVVTLQLAAGEGTHGVVFCGSGL